MTTAAYDISVNRGSVCFVNVLTRAARDWVRDNVPLESWQWQGYSFACECRMVDDLLEAMADDGLAVKP